MPIGPHGEKRPGDTLANALHVARLATGEAEETYVDPARQAAAKKGGKARAAALTPERRREIARKAAAVHGAAASRSIFRGAWRPHPTTHSATETASIGCNGGMTRR